MATSRSGCTAELVTSCASGTARSTGAGSSRRKGGGAFAPWCDEIPGPGSTSPDRAIRRPSSWHVAGRSGEGPRSRTFSAASASIRSLADRRRRRPPTRRGAPPPAVSCEEEPSSHPRSTPSAAPAASRRHLRSRGQPLGTPCQSASVETAAGFLWIASAWRGHRSREGWAIAAAVVFAGLWSGLLGMLTLVMHPMLAAMDGRGFERFLQAFLSVARKAWFNYVCAIGMAVADRRTRGLWGDRSSAAFILTAIGLAFVIVGVYLVSNVWKEPHYDVMLAWDRDAMPPEWEAGRRRYFRLNWIQPPRRGRRSASSWSHRSACSDRACDRLLTCPPPRRQPALSDTSFHSLCRCDLRHAPSEHLGRLALAHRDREGRGVQAPPQGTSATLGRGGSGHESVRATTSGVACGPVTPPCADPCRARMTAER